MRQGSFWDQLSDDEGRWLERDGRVVTVRAGSVLIAEGQASGRVWVVRSGRMKVVAHSERGHEVVLAVRGPGDLLGELSALDGLPASATVTAIEDGELLSVSTVRFRAFLAAHPEVTLALLGQISGRLRDADRKRVEFGSTDTVARLASRLVELAAHHGRDVGGAIAIDLPLTQTELAGWVGASREAVTRGLHTLRQRGCITTGRRTITVLDLDELRRWAV